ncbi:MAG: type II secretion system F family protein, partial [bacterium]|nr:type II secretion system F family protein [bacterium]
MNKLTSIFKRTRFTIKEQSHFAKRLSFLVKSGVPILESLRILRRQTKSKARLKLFDKIIDDVSNGQYLATSLKKLPNMFGDFAINIIKVGEKSGTLDKNLNYLSEELKKKQALKQKIIGAFVYPIFITLSTVGLAVLLTVFIFPKIQPIFDSLHISLPLSTRILLFVSTFLGNYGLYLLAILVFLVIVFFVAFNKFPSFHLLIDRFILKIPLFGKITQSYNVTNFCRTLGLLLKSGVIVTEALSITG